MGTTQDTAPSLAIEAVVKFASIAVLMAISQD